MRRLAILTLCTAAAMAAAALAAGAASAAAPELGRCVKKPVKPGYKDAGCEKGLVASGAFEWLSGPGPKDKFTSTAGASKFESVGKIKMLCKSETDGGEYTSPKGDLETIVLQKCETRGSNFMKGPCQNGGPGEITTALLSTTLGFILAPGEVGVSLENPTGGPVAEFLCDSTTVKITGSVIAKITPISKMSLAFKELFKQAVGLQAPEAFELQPKDTSPAPTATGRRRNSAASPPR